MVMVMMIMTMMMGEYVRAVIATTLGHTLPPWSHASTMPSASSSAVAWLPWHHGPQRGGVH